MSKTIDICLCTFQRPFITQALHSLITLEREPEWQIRVFVVDNDDTPSAKANVEQTFQRLPFPALYHHAPARNISIARNACLAQSDAGLLAFMDDDETATPRWLAALVSAQEKESAAAVLGPVDAVYPPNTPGWMRSGDFHATRPVWVGGTLITGYSCNLLLNRADPALANLEFQLDLGNTGGEDTVFLSTVHARGGIIAYAPEALLYEPVTPGRVSLNWLLKRRFRSGQTHALVLLKRDGESLPAKAKLFVIWIGKGLICSGLALVSLRPAWVAKWLLKAALQWGVVARLAGKKELRQYG